jgi:hypothetical protein
MNHHGMIYLADGLHMFITSCYMNTASLSSPISPTVFKIYLEGEIISYI